MVLLISDNPVQTTFKFLLCYDYGCERIPCSPFTLCGEFTMNSKWNECYSENFRITLDEKKNHNFKRQNSPQKILRHAFVHSLFRSY